MIAAAKTSAGNVRITLVMDFHPQEARELCDDLRRDPTTYHTSMLAETGRELAAKIATALETR